jgi:hypothetical protein
VSESAEIWIRDPIGVPRCSPQSGTPYNSEKVEIYSETKAYIDRDSFGDWFRDTFIPVLAARREQYRFFGRAILILDNCSAHRGPEFERLCQEHWVIVMWLPPHSLNQPQMLDLYLFGATKKLIARINKLERVNVQTDHIVRALGGFMAAAVPHNILASFGNAGVLLLLDDDRAIRCMVTPETTRCLLGALFSARLPIPEEEEEDLNMLGYTTRSDREISRLGKGKGMVNPDSSKQDRGRDDGLKSQAMTRVRVVPSVWINPRSLFVIGLVDVN